MARVLGLDLGSYSVKAVVFETSLRGFGVRAFREVKLPPGEDKTARVQAALTELLADRTLSSDALIVSVPGTQVVTHGLTMPFSDSKRIDATLGFEVEGQLPFDLSDAIFDYQVASTTDKGSQLLIGVIRKNELSQLLEQLKATRLDPRVVTHAALAYQNLLGPLGESADGAVAVIDIGHERTSVAVGTPQGIELARTFAGGGAALTKALAAEFKIPLDEAQTWKEEHGAVASEVVGADAERAAGAFLRGLQPLLRELRSTLKSYSGPTKRAVTKVYLCGGTGKLKGLAEQLTKDLNVQVEVLKLSAEELPEIAQAGASAAQAWALGMRGVASGAKVPRFNLRRGEFAFKSDFDFVKDKLPQLATFAAILLVLLIAGGIVRNTVLERRDKQLDVVLCDITQRVLGKCEPDIYKATNLLEGQGSPAAVIPKQSAVSLLAELTQRIPADANVTLDQIVVDLDRITLRCEVGSSKQVEDLIAALKTYKCFKEVKEGKIEKNKDGTKVGFRLDIQVDCPGGAS